MQDTQLGRVTSIPLTRPDPDGFHGRLQDFLLMFVPLRIWELRGAADAEIERLRLKVTEMIGSHGDDLQFGGKYQTEARVALIDALAILARADGGANMFGVHACFAPHEGCPAGQ